MMLLLSVVEAFSPWVREATIIENMILPPYILKSSSTQKAHVGTYYNGEIVGIKYTQQKQQRADVVFSMIYTSQTFQ
jgi:hypothetical protein